MLCFLLSQVVMEDDQALADGEKIANELMKKLGVDEKDLVTGAYMDLLLKA